MKATKILHDLGQSLWLDNITRELLTSGTLKKYIDTLSVTGLTSNPTIFDHAISRSNAYDSDIRRLTGRGLTGEPLFFELAIEDLTQAAELFAPIHERTDGVDGWVSLELSPLLAYDSQKSASEAKALHDKVNRRNVFIKIPGTKEGLPAIEETIAAGVPVNVTLLFSREQYLAAADAYLRGLERRYSAGLSLNVHSAASIFVSRWDKATMDKVAADLRDKLGIAISKQAYKAYRDLLESDRWQRLAAHGARPQRILFASTGTKDPEASDVLYIAALAAPNTINTMPEETLLAFDAHGTVEGVLPRGGGDCDEDIAAYVKAGVDVPALADKLQEEGAKSFDASWQDLMNSLAAKSRAVA
ncbi:MAG: transaldolase [Beijerinckiaceae bacterium]|nr:transaldolase [Beijerinckiaceae bacterium]